MTYEEIVSRFQVKQRNEDSVKCICPAHKDDKPSLSITREHGKTLIHCHAGCETSVVLGAVGLSMKDLYEDDEPRRPEIEAEYHYHNIDTGKEEFVRRRMEGKVFCYGSYDGNRFVPGLNKRKRKDIPAVYGDLVKIRSADAVYYCEGEKDVNSVMAAGYAAVTCGGSSDWTSKVKKLFTGKRVYILADNDEPGEKLAEEVAKDLTGIAKTVKVIVPYTAIKGGDITDYLRAGGKMEDLTKSIRLQTVADIEEQEVSWVFYGYMPKGQITLLAGDGGEGKTAIWCNLVAGYTTGKKTILEENNPFPKEEKPGIAMFFSSEDSVPKVLKGRLKKSGADEGKIMFIDMADKTFSKIKFNSPELEEIIAEYRPGLVVFDPLQSFIPPDVQMGSRNAMRQCIAPLVVLGEKYGATFLIVMHTNKKQNAYGRTRCADSADVWDQARSVLIAGSTGEAGEHYLSLEKSNYGSEQPTIIYSIEEGRAVFRGTTNKHDRDYMQDNVRFNKAAPARSEAKQIIMTILSDGLEHRVADVDKALDDQGVTFATRKRSKEELKKEGHIQYRVEGSGKNKVFYIKRI